MLIAIAKSVKRINVWFSINSPNCFCSIRWNTDSELPKHLKYVEYILYKKTNKNHSIHGKYTERLLFSASKRLLIFKIRTNVRMLLKISSFGTLLPKYSCGGETRDYRYEIFFCNFLATRLKNNSTIIIVNFVLVRQKTGRQNKTISEIEIQKEMPVELVSVHEKFRTQPDFELMDTISYATAFIYMWPNLLVLIMFYSRLWKQLDQCVLSS